MEGNLRRIHFKLLIIRQSVMITQYKGRHVTFAF